MNNRQTEQPTDRAQWITFISTTTHSIKTAEKRGITAHQRVEELLAAATVSSLEQVPPQMDAHQMLPYPCPGYNIYHDNTVATRGHHNNIVCCHSNVRYNVIFTKFSQSFHKDAE
jgi:hypothetical protein